MRLGREGTVFTLGAVLGTSDIFSLKFYSPVTYVKFYTHLTDETTKAAVLHKASCWQVGEHKEEGLLNTVFADQGYNPSPLGSQL